MTTTMGATTANVAHGLVDAAVDAEGEAISSGGNLIDDLVESVGARAAAALMIGGYRSRAAPGIEMDGVLGSAAVAPDFVARQFLGSFPRLVLGSARGLQRVVGLG